MLFHGAKTEIDGEIDIIREEKIMIWAGILYRRKL